MIVLREYAKRTNEIGQDISSKSEQIITHLLKIFYYRNNEELVDHWTGELWDFLHRIARLKTTKKFPNKGFILYHLWSGTEDTFENDLPDYINSLNRKYSKKLGRIELDRTCKDFCKKYMDWLAGALSEKGSVGSDDIFNEIETLLNKE